MRPDSTAAMPIRTGAKRSDRSAMKRNRSPIWGHRAGSINRPGGGRLLVFAVALAMVAGASASFAQQGGMLQQKLEAIQRSAQMNRTRLRQYQWTETLVLTLRGEAKPARVSLCHYGPDGTVRKTPVGPPPDAQQYPGGLRGRIMERRTDELKGYLQDAQEVMALYVPPDAAQMQQSFKNGNASLSEGGAGTTRIVFTNYAKPGDQMTLSFDMRAKRIVSLSVNSTMSESRDPVSLTVQFATLPDGTNFPSQTTLSAPARQIQVATTNSNYQKLAGQ